MCLFFSFQPLLIFSILKQSSPVTDRNVCVILNPVKLWISMISYGMEFHRPILHSINTLTPFNVPISIMLKKDLFHFCLVPSFTLSSQFQV